LQLKIILSAQTQTKQLDLHISRCLRAEDSREQQKLKLLHKKELNSHSEIPVESLELNIIYQSFQIQK